MKYGMQKDLTAWRGETDWLRDFPAIYARDAIIDASVACLRVVEDNSEMPPYRSNGGRIILESVRPPVVKGDRLLYLPAYGVVQTIMPVDDAWGMRSFKIVDVTDKVTRRTTPADHKFELHITIHVPVKQRRRTGVIRGVDVGGRRMVVAADTECNVEIHDVAHRRLLFEIRALKSVRDLHTHGGRRWSKLNKKILRLRAKTNRVGGNSVKQAVAKTVRGADAVVVEGVDPKVMPAHGGNRKKGMNRSSRESRMGEFLRKTEQACRADGRDLRRAPAPYTCQTCNACGHVDSKSRVSRGRFVCVNCHRKFHADINAAWNVLCRAAGIVALLLLGVRWGYKTKPRPVLLVMVEASRKGNGGAGDANYCI